MLLLLLFSLQTEEMALLVALSVLILLEISFWVGDAAPMYVLKTPIGLIILCPTPATPIYGVL